MFEITETVLSKTKAQKFMDVGVHENVELTEIKVEISKNNTPYLAFTYTNELGQKAYKTEWETNTPKGKTLESLTEEEREIYDDLCRKQMRRVLYVAKQFVPDDQLYGKKFKDFMEFATFIKTKLSPEIRTGVKLRIKVAYDKGSWITTPNYVREVTNPWIERMDTIPAEKSKIKIDPASDKVYKDVASVVSSKPNPLKDTEESSSPKTGYDLGKTLGGTFPKSDLKNDLPF